MGGNVVELCPKAVVRSREPAMPSPAARGGIGPPRRRETEFMVAEVQKPKRGRAELLQQLLRRGC